MRPIRTRPRGTTFRSLQGTKDCSQIRQTSEHCQAEAAYMPRSAELEIAGLCHNAPRGMVIFAQLFSANQFLATHDSNWLKELVTGKIAVLYRH